jgi:2-polyprenyl-3-methyl-5-hydroxy-6-metoxy-1,4-benzoquinol methylase
MSRAPAMPAGEIERIVPGTTAWDELLPEHLQRYEFVAQRLPAQARVLDAGCGVGYGAALLADRGAARVVAVDLSAEALAIGRGQFQRPAIHWIQEDCQALEQARGAGPFDVICQLENLEHLSDPERFLDVAARELAPRGLLITSTPDRIGVRRMRGADPSAATSNPFHVREYDAAQFRELLAKHFERITLHYQTLLPIERMILEPALDALWRNPMVRLGRWMQCALRGRDPARRLADLVPARRYQILESFPGDELVITLIAECASPRNAPSR